MGTVTGLTAARMEAIEAASVVDGHVDGSGHLILEKFDASTIDAGSVIGPTGSPGISVGTFDAGMLAHVPPGTIVDYMGTTAPSGGKWLLMNGQTVTSAQSLYPDLWAVLPAAMKSGTSLLMPDTRGRMTVGYASANTKFDSIGETGGSETHTLAQTELPNATITIDPPSFAINPPNLVVSIDPPATAVTGNTGYELQTHTHQPTSAVHSDIYGSRLDPGVGGPLNILSGTQAQGATGIESASHQHPAGSLQVDIAPFNVNVDIPSFNADPSSFNSGALGAGAAHNNMPPYITFQKILKVL